MYKKDTKKSVIGQSIWQLLLIAVIIFGVYILMVKLLPQWQEEGRNNKVVEILSEVQGIPSSFEHSNDVLDGLSGNPPKPAGPHLVEELLLGTKYMGYYPVYIIETAGGTKVYGSFRVRVEYGDSIPYTQLTESKISVLGLVEVNSGQVVLSLPTEVYKEMSKVYAQVTKNTLKGHKVD